MVNFMYVNVALNIPSDKTFTYEVPDHLDHEIEIGKRVFVPFGNKNAPDSSWKHCYHATCGI